VISFFRREQYWVFMLTYPTYYAWYTYSVNLIKFIIWNFIMLLKAVYMCLPLVILSFIHYYPYCNSLKQFVFSLDWKLSYPSYTVVSLSKLSLTCMHTCTQWCIHTPLKAIRSYCHPTTSREICTPLRHSSFVQANVLAVQIPWREATKPDIPLQSKVTQGK